MPRSPRVRTAWILFGFLSIVYALTINQTVSLDVYSAHFGAWHLVSTGSPWIENANFIEGHDLRDVWVTTNGAHEVIARAPGVIAAGLPAYFFAQADGMTGVPGGLTAAVLAAASVALMFLVVSKRLELRVSVLVALVFGLATPVWSVAANGLWPHTLTVLSVAAMAWSAQRGNWWLVGLFGGIGVWGRIHFAVIVAILGVVEAVRKRDPRIAVATAVPSLAMLGLLVVWTRWMYGEWRLTGNYSGESLDSMRELYSSLPLNELGLFFSLGRGFFVWTPVALILIPAVYRAWNDLPSWSRTLLIGGVAYTLLQGYLNRFQGGDSYWGYRLTLELLACGLPAFAFSLPRMGAVTSRLLGPLAALQFMLILPGAILPLGTPLAEDAWWDFPLVTILIREPASGVIVIAGLAMVCYALPRAVGRHLRAPGVAHAS